MSTVHIESKENEISNVVLMPGDPKRSEYIAKNFLKDYKIVNTVRGAIAYTGYYKDKLVTVFTSGMGCPSMGIYSYELFKFYDVEYIIRIGSCGVYDKKLKFNDVILVDDSYSNSAYAYELDRYKSNIVSSDEELNLVIENASKINNINLIKGNIMCTDAFYEAEFDVNKRCKDKNVLGVEMETFALFNNARNLGKKAGALLTVTDLLFDKDAKRLSSEEREKGLNDMITLALESCLKL